MARKKKEDSDEEVLTEEQVEDLAASTPIEEAPKQKRASRVRQDSPGITFGLMDVMHSGISPDFYADFMECCDRLATLKRVFKFSDKDVLDSIIHYELQGKVK